MSNVFWITGLSAAGKTTLATKLTEHIKEKAPCVMLDGDQLREALSATEDFSGNARYDLAFKYARLAKLISSQGIIVIVSTVALINDIHLWNRENIPGYFEIYIKVPLKELRRRDPKGLYKRFDSGEISNVAGLDLVIEEPKRPDLLLDYGVNKLLPEEQLRLIIDGFNSSTQSTVVTL
jgi:adenylylsulfate kinase